MADADELTIEEIPNTSRYVLTRDGERIGVLNYHRSDGTLILTHVEVEPALEGRGYGSRFTAAVLDDCRAKGLKVIPECPFIVRYIREHPEQADLLA